VKSPALFALQRLRALPSGVINLSNWLRFKRGLLDEASTHEGQSMKVDEATVRHVARLARIKVTTEQAKALEGELSAILDWVEQLGEVDTANVEPMTRVEAMALPKREDKVTDGDIPDLVVKNAPFTEDNFFLVPKVVE
jgi:aspartyl-tRNA(Asn)/glutamyl-tRNA(Gln) amidotransferase subunit C